MKGQCNGQCKSINVTWKMSNVCPVYTQKLKKLKENYRPISLLPIQRKILDKILFDSLYDYFITKKFLTSCQSGFMILVLINYYR